MILPSNFELNMYGLFIRFVNESDARFIVDLRKEQRARFLKQTSSNISHQEKWISQYKEREYKGTDYYLIYYVDGEPVGVNRIHNIQKDSFISGSLVFKSSCEFDVPLKATLIAFYIGFELLDKSVSFGNINKQNVRAIKFNRILGGDFVYSSDTEEYFVLTKKTYLLLKSKLANTTFG